jgi:hypothetical protein
MTRIKLDTIIKRAYRQWCENTFPDYNIKDFPCKGRLYETWHAAWMSAYAHILRGDL